MNPIAYVVMPFILPSVIIYFAAITVYTIAFIIAHVSESLASPVNQLGQFIWGQTWLPLYDNNWLVTHFFIGMIIIIAAQQYKKFFG